MDGKELSGLEDKSEAKNDLLTKLGIYDFDEGCDHFIRRPKKRVALSKNFGVDPTEVLILDEPNPTT